MNDYYYSVTQDALIMCQGDVQKADYMLDCSWYEYMYRRENFKRYSEWYAEQVKDATKK